jgi:ArsR family transcriptional regulator, arsenate/arsenite/antimonite-responsive transcriptional repressor
MPKAPDPDPIDLVFRALASKQRREILSLLATGDGSEDAGCCSAAEVCACVFAEKLGLGASTVSHHMKALIGAGLVTAEKRGLWVYYRLRTDTIAAVGRELLALACGTSCAPAEAALVRLGNE